MGLRILVADDASFIRDMVKRSLREKLPGTEVFEAPDGSRALAQLKAQTMDLILSDWEMPNLSGEELLKSLRGDERYSNTPFIMISSRGDRSHVIQAVEAGVSDYLTKPFTSEELIRKVLKQLKKAGKSPGGESPQSGGGNSANQGTAFGSVGVLTGNKEAAATAQPAPKASAKPTSKLQAQLRLGNNQKPVGCIVRDCNLQALSAVISREKGIPALFDQVVIDLGEEGGEPQVQLNAYVHSLQSAENRPESKVVKIVLRFVDKDMQKFEILSRMTGKR